MTIEASRPLLHQSPSPKGRELWIDVAKGVGICLVVFGHAMNGLGTAGILKWETPITQLYFIIYTFHMPLFFFLSGITVTRSLNKGTFEFLAGKVRYIVYPYFVWSIIQGLSQAALSDQLNHSFDISSLYGIYAHPLAQFWFLYVLIIYHLLAAATGGRGSILIPASILGLVVYSSLPIIPSMASFYLGSYTAGVVLNDKVSDAIGKIRHPILIGVLSLLACAFAALLSTPITNWNYLNLWILPSTFFGVFGTIVLCKLANDSTVSRVLAYLGRLSLAIYVMHVMAAAGARVVLVRLHLAQDPYILLALCTLAGVILPVIVYRALEHLNLLGVLGLEGRSRSRSLRRANA